MLELKRGVLESPTTGIVDSHALMQYLQGDFENAGGIVAFKSEVVGVEGVDGGRGGWRIRTRDPDDSNSNKKNNNNGDDDETTTALETTTITSSTLINSSGLSAIPLSNKILPPARHLTPIYAKGTYFSYANSSPRTKTLIYPAPVPGHAGLGTHLTLDLGGRIRFGPDVSWTTDPSDYTPNTANLPAAIREIRTYLPGVEESALAVDYAGIRPKLGRGGAAAMFSENQGSGKGGSFQDFYIKKENGYEGFVNLLGIESPGLTSCLAIAERGC